MRAPGWWQVAHAIVPVRDSRRIAEQALRRARWPPRCPDTRFDGSAPRGGGHGPSARMRRTSRVGEARGQRRALARRAGQRSACAAATMTSTAASITRARIALVSRSVVVAASRGRTSGPSGPACGTSGLRRDRCRRRATVDAGAVVHAVPVLRHVGVDAHRLRRRAARCAGTRRSRRRSAGRRRSGSGAVAYATT